MSKKFYEYSESFGYPVINEVTYPHCPMWGEDPDVFLIYAENEKEAFKLAMAHLFENKPMDSFYGTYAGDRWDGVKCVM